MCFTDVCLFGVIVGPCWGHLGPSWSVMGRLGRYVEPSWDPFWQLWMRFGALWVVLGRSGGSGGRPGGGWTGGGEFWKSVPGLGQGPRHSDILYITTMADSLEEGLNVLPPEIAAPTETCTFCFEHAVGAPADFSSRPGGALDPVILRSMPRGIFPVYSGRRPIPTCS